MKMRSNLAAVMMVVAFLSMSLEPAFATALAPARRQDTALMAELAGLAKGTL